MDEKELEHMLEKGLSDFDFSLERRQAVLQTIRKKENPVVKRKASAVLVLAVVLSLLIGGAASLCAQNRPPKDKDRQKVTAFCGRKSEYASRKTDVPQQIRRPTPYDVRTL